MLDSKRLRPILAVLPAGYRSPATTAMLAVLREVSEDLVRGQPNLAVPRPVPALSA
jgi:hypothetical protein